MAPLRPVLDDNIAGGFAINLLFDHKTGSCDVVLVQGSQYRVADFAWSPEAQRAQSGQIVESQGYLLVLCSTRLGAQQEGEQIGDGQQSFEPTPLLNLHFDSPGSTIPCDSSTAFKGLVPILQIQL